MARYAKGEDRVFEQVYRLLAPRLYRFCSVSRRTGQTPTIYFKRLSSGCIARATYVSGANVLPWGFAIARSVYLDRLEYWRRRP